MLCAWAGSCRYERLLAIGEGDGVPLSMLCASWRCAGRTGFASGGAGANYDASGYLPRFRLVWPVSLLAASGPIPGELLAAAWHLRGGTARATPGCER